MISAPGLEGEAASRGQEIPPPVHRRGRQAAGSRGACKAGEAVPAAGVPPRQEPQVPLRSEQAPEAVASDSCNTLANQILVITKTCMTTK
jgi:hypothetical protein